MSKRKADVVQVWDIFGEDPNCDLGGPHHEPHLDTVEGTYEQALAYGKKLPGWNTWGAGGRVSPAKIPNVKKLNDLKPFRVRIYKDMVVQAGTAGEACQTALKTIEYPDQWKADAQLDRCNDCGKVGCDDADCV